MFSLAIKVFSDTLRVSEKPADGVSSTLFEGVV